MVAVLLLLISRDMSSKNAKGRSKCRTRKCPPNCPLVMIPEGFSSIKIASAETNSTSHAIILNRHNLTQDMKKTQEAK